MARDEGTVADKMIAELAAIRINTTRTWGRAFGYGFLQGAGFVLGSAVIVAIIGALLKLFGVLPGIGVIATYLSTHLHFGGSY